jgi:methyl-accepting chemotaxis protein
VGETHTSLEKIGTLIQRLSEQISRVATASQEQSKGTEEINQALLELQNIVQQNATLVGDLAHSSQMLADSADGLQLSTEGFILPKEIAVKIPDFHTPSPLKKEGLQKPKDRRGLEPPVRRRLEEDLQKTSVQEGKPLSANDLDLEEGFEEF